MQKPHPLSLLHQRTPCGLTPLREEAGEKMGTYARPIQEACLVPARVLDRRLMINALGHPFWVFVPSGHVSGGGHQGGAGSQGELGGPSAGRTPGPL